MRKKELTTDELWDELVALELFTDAELRLLTNINGYTVDTLNDAIFARYGYRDFNQMMKSEQKMRSENDK